MDDLAHVFKALSDGTRLRILALLLRHGELCVCDVERILGITQSKSSRHLRYLEHAGLLESRRDNVWVFYRVDPKPGSDRECILKAVRRLMTAERVAELEARVEALRTRDDAPLATCRAPADQRARELAWPRHGSQATGESAMRKRSILFLCTGNSCRSQMAEGWARQLKGDVLDAYSAGIEAHGLDPNAVKVMAEVGVDIAHHRSKRVEEVEGGPFDAVVTVCGHANESCPVFPAGTKVLHVGFDDPPALATGTTSEPEALAHYRRVRDEIRAFIAALPDVLDDAGGER